MSRSCTKCGNNVPADAVGNLCPACLPHDISDDETRTATRKAGPDEAGNRAPDEAPMLHGQFEPGDVLIDRYRIVSLLGQGGMGEVYRADDLVLREPVALKILPAHLVQRQAILEALHNEVRQARLVSHRHVCRVHDISQIGGRPLLSMELIEGEDLASLLRRIGQLSAGKAIQLATQLAEGLAAAHEQGVLHLDLKPANLMINREGNIKISDFGLSRLSSTVHADDRIAGTPAYMAPEQAWGEKLSPRTDLYAFGLIFYEMLTGQRARSTRTLEEVRAFSRGEKAIEPPSRHVPGLDHALEKLVLACLEHDAALRPESMDSILQTLKTLGTPGAASHGGQNPLPQESSIEESDVYLSFAPVDDVPVSTSKAGWISQFHRNLEIRVEQLSGRRLRVFRPARRPGDDDPETAILESLPRVKALVSVISPPFAHSPGCRREVETFWESNAREGRLYVEGHTRVLKVVKTPVENEELPAELRDKFQELLGYEFFEHDPSTGRLREYAEWFGHEAEQRFHERIYDLAQEINALFKAMGKAPPEARGKGKTIYVATTTSDVAPLRDRIRRELIGRGHRVLPERPLPLVAHEAGQTIRACLAECDLAVHTFGRTYGVVPEGSDHSFTALQNLIAAEQSQHTGLRRVIWIPSDVTPTDARQEALLHSLKTDSAAHHNAEIVVNTFQTLKPIILDRLAPTPVPANPAPGSEGATRTPRIYLICDPNDEEAIEPLEDYLFEQGFDVTLPDFDADEAEAARTHRENLCECDGVIIFYGAARHSWVDVKLRNLQKMSGYGRESTLAFNAIYIAPPFDRRKERYRTHDAEIIRQGSTFDPGLLGPLLQRCAGA